MADALKIQRPQTLQCSFFEQATDKRCVAQVHLKRQQQANFSAIPHGNWPAGLHALRELHIGSASCYTSHNSRNSDRLSSSANANCILHGNSATLSSRQQHNINLNYQSINQVHQRIDVWFAKAKQTTPRGTTLIPRATHVCACWLRRRLKTRSKQMP